MPSAEYLAGFVDGEGCFHITTTGQPTLTLSQKIIDPLLAIQKVWGGTIYEDKLRWTGEDAARVAENILPYLLLKQDQARWLIRHTRNRPGYGSRTTWYKDWCGFSNTFIKHLRKVA